MGTGIRVSPAAVVPLPLPIAGVVAFVLFVLLPPPTGTGLGMTVLLVQLSVGIKWTSSWPLHPQQRQN